MRPAQAMKFAFELEWSGVLGGKEPACEYIFDQSPGVVPFAAYNPGWGGLSCLDGTDTGPQGRPCQAVGLQFSLTQAALSQSLKELLELGNSVFGAGIDGTACDGTPLPTPSPSGVVPFGKRLRPVATDVDGRLPRAQRSRCS